MRIAQRKAEKERKKKDKGSYKNRELTFAFVHAATKYS